MAPLIEYISQEDLDVAVHLNYINRVHDILQNLRQTLDLKDVNDPFNSAEHPEHSEGKITEPDRDGPDKSDTNRDSESEELRVKMMDLIASEEKIEKIKEKHMNRLDDQKIQYRKDLIKQIKEKQDRRKKLKESIRKEDKLLESKILQQRLAMNLEYIEEQQKADFFIKKPTKFDLNNEKYGWQKNRSQIMENDESVNTNDSSNLNVACKNETKKALEKTQLVTEQNRKEISDPCNDKNMNFLTDLNEVRKIMRSDHYELLSKLIEWNI